MASPFHVFRKNQKVLLVVFGLAAMFVFVVGDAIMSMVDSKGGGGAEDPIVAKWNGGEMTRNEVINQNQLRVASYRFLQAAAQLGYSRTFEEPTVGILHGVRDEREITPEATVSVALIAEEAKEQGFVVDDHTVNLYLSKLTQAKVSNPELANLMDEARGNNPRVSQQLIFDSLKTEMLANQFRRSMLATSGLITPVEMWMPFSRLNDVVTIQTLAVPVADFVSKVAEPSEDEIKKFYDEHKDTLKRHAQIGLELHESPEPGFKSPEKISLQYLRADFEAFLAKIQEEITDEEIKEYYEGNKAQYLLLGQEPTDEAPTEEAPADQETTPEEPAETPPGSSESEKSETEPETKTEESGETEEKPAENKPEPAESKLEAKPPESKEDAKPVPEKKDGGSVQIQLDRVELVNFQEEKKPASDPDAQPPAPRPDEPAKPKTPEAQDSPDKPAPDQAKDKKPEAKTESKDAPATAEQPADAKASEEAKPAPSADTTDSPMASTPESETAAESDSQEQPADTAVGSGIADLSKPLEEPKLYRPLEEVTEDIRLLLARERAAIQIQEVLKGPEKVMKRYSREYRAWQIAQSRLEESKRSDKDRPTPPTPNELKQGTPLILESTAQPMAHWQLLETDIGKTTIAQIGYQLSNFLFSPQGNQDYATIEAEDRTTGDQYLVWRTQMIPSSTPPLDEIRAQVVLQWKLKKARELALKKAEELAAKATKQGGSLSEVFPKSETGPQVVDSQPFAWLTEGPAPGSQQGRLRLSEVEGVLGAGDTFMEKVFSLEPGDVDSAMNFSESDAYVIRLVGHENSLRERHADFMKSPLEMKFAQLYGSMQQTQANLSARALFSSLRKKLDLEFNMDGLDGEEQDAESSTDETENGEEESKEE